MKVALALEELIKNSSTRHHVNIFFGVNKYANRYKEHNIRQYNLIMYKHVKRYKEQNKYIDGSITQSCDDVYVCQVVFDVVWFKNR